MLKQNLETISNCIFKVWNNIYMLHVDQVDNKDTRSEKY